MMQWLLPACLLALVVTAFPAQGGFTAEDTDDASPLLVGAKPSPPFVMMPESSGNLSGFSIDLIRLVAARMAPPRQIRFQVQKDLDEHLNAVHSGQADLGISATSFSSERQRTMDFSVAFYQSGLDIAV